MKCAIKLKFYSTYYWHNNIYYEIIKVFFMVFLLEQDKTAHQLCEFNFLWSLIQYRNAFQRNVHL